MDTGNHGRDTLKTLRPLAWWLFLVLILAGIHWNLVMLERTRLYFSTSLNGQPVPYLITETLDGRPIANGDRIPLGNHHFEITGSQTDPVTMDLSIWYGKHDLGEIRLKRSTGTLSVNSTPPAQLIAISGSEFSTNISNSSGVNLTVPTDTYTVSAQYPHWNGSQTALVMRDATASITFSPRFGALHITCNRDGATFQLRDANGQNVTSGNTSDTIIELPTGSYQLTATHHNHQLQKSVTVDANVTNEVPVDFQYGGAIFESDPSGAAVYGDDRSYWGQTPLELSELTPQTLHFQLELNGYKNVPATLDVVADQTNTFHANLVSFNYINAMQSARDYLAQSNYIDAMTFVNGAIAAKLDDADAIALQKQIHFLSDIQQAQNWQDQSNYIKGIEILNDALSINADNDQAKTMLAFDALHKPEQVERERIERLNRPRNTFNDVLQGYPDAALFDEHELTTSKPYREAGGEIASALSSGQPMFRIADISLSEPETYAIEATYEIPGLLGAATTSGRRQCIIVCGQAKDDETQIYYKVLEYKAKSNVPFSIGAMLHTATPDHADYIPIHPSRIQMTDALEAQLTNGVQIVTERIRQVISQ